MSDALITTADREEEFSRVYVSAVAAGAGYTTALRNFDRDGVDTQIQAGGSMRPALDVQLKATVNLGQPKDGYYHFPLPRRNYDLLRESTLIPRVLVVLDLPKTEADWLLITPEKLVLQRCAYWISLREAKATDNTTSITVLIDAQKRFDTNSLKALMDKARTGGPL